MAKKKKTKTKRLVCSDWNKLLREIPGYDPFDHQEEFWFDAEEAERQIWFFHEKLTHTIAELAGTPFILGRWQQSIIANIFGWKRPDGTRRYREVFIFIPRKNGKSLMVAGIGNSLLFVDGEMGAEIYSAAGDKDQASLVWGMAKQQVLNDEELKKNCKIYTASKSLNIESMGSFFKPISHDAGTKHGFNAHGVLFDELHVQKDGELLDTLETSMGARRQPLLVHLTTSDYNRPSICNEKYEYACEVRDNAGDKAKPGYDPYFLPVIYEADKDDDWTDPKTWAKANPNLGVSVKLEYLERQCKKAQKTPRDKNKFLRLHLNIRTDQDVAWLDYEHWRQCGGKIDIAKLKEKMCFGGLDLSSTTDLSAYVKYFPYVDNPQFRDKKGKLICKFWLPKSVLDDKDRENYELYKSWADMGLLTLTPGNVIDYRFIRKEIKSDSKKFDMQSIGYDPYNATQLCISLRDEDGINMIEHRQGFISMNEPTKEFERMVIGHELNHGENPILNWMAGNAMVREDPHQNIKVVKPKGKQKVDGIIASIMAISMSISEDRPQKSVYSKRGLRVL